MVQETGYPVKILSKLFISGIKQIHKIAFPRYTPNKQLDPMFITGLTDGEGSFIIKMSKTKLGWRVQLEFCIGMHIRDKDLMIQVQKFFGVGTLRVTNNAVYYSVRANKELLVVLSQKYPLLTI